jgi:hypothetical protein
MPPLPRPLVQQLDDVAHEMGEVFGDRGHRIDSAVSLDPAFSRNRRSRSSLTLDLMSDAFMAAASHVGLSPFRGTGGAVELLAEIPRGLANVRLRRAEKRGEEDFFVRSNAASKFGYVDERLLIPDYPYVFGFHLDALDQPEFFVAEVTRVIEGSPGELVLGPPHLLGGAAGPTPGGFDPDSDSWLPGFDEGEAERGADTA